MVGGVAEEEADREWRKCKKSFLYFLCTYVWITDRAEKETIKWNAWDYLVDLATLLPTIHLLIILKARQLGISWLIIAYSVWLALFHTNVKILLFSKGEKEASDLVGGGERAVPGKAKFIYNNLPDFLRIKLGRDTQSVMDFPTTGSIIESMASTPDAGRSTDASLIVCDEWEFHPYAEQNFAAVRPTIGNKGQFIAMSTADKTKINTFFKSIYIGAMNGSNNFTYRFLPYNLRPGRDEKWREELLKEMPRHQVEAEYPITESDALTTLKTIPFFDNDVLGMMLSDSISEIKCELSDQFKTVHVYKLPVVGRRYCLFTDPSDGKEDPHASVVKEVQSGEWVAVSHGKITADDCAQIHDALARFYNAFNSYELNARAGGMFSLKIDDLGTPNRCGFISTDGTANPSKHGWWTGRKARDNMEQSLEEAIRLQKVRVYYKPAIQEFMSYMRPEGDLPQAPKGGHDDFVIAGGGVEQIQRYLPSGTATVTSFKWA